MPHDALHQDRGVDLDASMTKSRVRHNEINCIFNIPNVVHVRIHMFPRE